MTVPFWSLLVILVIPYLLYFYTMRCRAQQLGEIENHYPRIQYTLLDGIGARACGAQKNAWEAAIMFTAAVMVAHLGGADPRLSSILAVTFVALRILHAVFYLADKPALRTLVFVSGTVCAVALFLLPALSNHSL